MCKLLRYIGKAKKMMGYNSLGQKTAICHWKKYNTLLVILANISCCILIRMMLWNPDGVCGNNFDLLQQHQGYQITSIQEMLDGNGIVAQMKLLRGTEIFGPDIENLKLSVRYVCMFFPDFGSHY